MRASGGMWVTGLLLAAACLGCEKRPLYQYNDEPYLRRAEALDDAQLRSQLQSLYRDEREMVLRVFASRGADALAGGRTVEARRLTRLLMAHYHRERDPRVRSSIVGVCLRRLGLREGGVFAFLRERLADGDCIIDASYTLVTLRAPKAYDAVAPLVRHPRADVRYEAALALSFLTDDRVAARLQEVARAMDSPTWPSVVGGVTKAQAQSNLVARAAALEAASAR